MRTLRRTVAAAGSIAVLTTALVATVSTPAEARTSCAQFEAIAHRGLHPTGVDENSMAAFQGAAERGYSVETDVWLDAEGVAWIFHDFDTFRATGVHGRIEDMTTQEVSQLRYTKAGAPLVTLADAMDFFATQPGLRVYVELKRDQRAYAEALAREVHDSDNVANTWATAALKTVHDVAPDLHLLLKAQNLPSPQNVLDRGADIVSLPEADLTSENVAEFQAAGIEVQGRQSNLTSDWQLTISTGADGQLTDLPRELLEYCASLARPPRITALDPGRAPRGTEITIRGRVFTDVSRVRFGHRQATFTVETRRRITAVVPRPLAKRTYVFVKTPGGLAKSADRFVAVRPR